MPFASADGTISVDLDLPDELRAELAKPYGPVLAEEDLAGHLRGCRRIFAIGDKVNISLVRMNIEPDVAVFDYRTARGSLDDVERAALSKIEGGEMKVDNPPGRLTAELWNAIAKAVRSGRKAKIEVRGEEDLASLACIELGDKGDCVIYGIPNEGITVIRIDEDIQKIVGGILARMSPQRRR